MLHGFVLFATNQKLLKRLGMVAHRYIHPFGSQNSGGRSKLSSVGTEPVWSTLESSGKAGITWEDPV